MIYLIVVLSLGAIGFGVYLLVKRIIDIRFERRLRSANFKKLYEASIKDVIEVCKEVGVTYWFTEGTLIGLLRYGSNTHESRERSIDDDIDLMIEATDQEDWIKTKKRLIVGLEARGWGGLYERTTSSSKSGRIDKMQLWRYAFDSKTHVDFHSYFVTEDYAFSHEEPNSYPFQYWDGKLPISMLYPMKKCLCYGQEVPCPNDPINLLKGWNGGEYEDSNIAFPLGKVTEEARTAIIEMAEALDQKGYASMKPEIEKA